MIAEATSGGELTFFAAFDETKCTLDTVAHCIRDGRADLVNNVVNGWIR